MLGLGWKDDPQSMSSSANACFPVTPYARDGVYSQAARRAERWRLCESEICVFSQVKRLKID